jgi:hypothetical protein
MEKRTWLKSLVFVVLGSCLGAGLAAGNVEKGGDWNIFAHKANISVKGTPELYDLHYCGNGTPLRVEQGSTESRCTLYDNDDATNTPLTISGKLMSDQSLTAYWLFGGAAHPEDTVTSSAGFYVYLRGGLLSSSGLSGEGRTVGNATYVISGGRISQGLVAAYTKSDYTTTFANNTGTIQGDVNFNVSGGTINSFNPGGNYIKTAAEEKYAIASASDTSKAGQIRVNLSGNPSIGNLYLFAINDSRTANTQTAYVDGALAESASINLVPATIDYSHGTGGVYGEGGYATAIPNGTVLVESADSSYISPDNFNISSKYTGTDGVIKVNPSNAKELIFSTDAADIALRQVAPKTQFNITGNQGVISSASDATADQKIMAGSTYVLKDSSGNSYVQVAVDDGMGTGTGKLVIDEWTIPDSTNNVTITSIALKGNDTKLYNSTPETVSYTTYKEGTPTLAYTASTDTLTGFFPNEKYRLDFTDGTSIDLTPAAASYCFLDYADFASISGKTLKSAYKYGMDETAFTLTSSNLTYGDYTVSSTLHYRGYKLTGLDPNTVYQISSTSPYTSGSYGYPRNLASDASGTIDSINTDSKLDKIWTAAANESTITAVSRIKTIGSKLESLSGMILPRQAAPSSAIYNQATGYLTGLPTASGIVVTFSDSTTYTIPQASIQSDGTFDLASVASLAHKTIASLVAQGISGTTIDSESYTSADLAKEVLPRVAVNASGSTTGYTDGVLTGLVPNQSYQLTISGSTDPITVTADASGQIDATKNSALYGKTVTALTGVGDQTSTINSLPQTVSYQMPVKLATPSYIAYDGAGTISGLLEGHTYSFAFKDVNGTVTTKTFTADATGKIVISDTANRDLAGLTVTSITDQGAIASGTLDSEAYEPAGGIVLPTKEVISAAPTFDIDTAVVSGLEPGCSYILKGVHNGTAISTTVVAGSDGKIDLATAYPGMVYSAVTSMIKCATAADKIQSDEMDLSAMTDFYVLKHEPTPTATYSVQGGKFYSLLQNQKYIITFSDGTSKTITALADGTYSATDDADMTGKTISGITQVGDGMLFCNSLAETSATGTVYPRYQTPAASYADGYLTNLTPGVTYEVAMSGSFTDIETADADGKIDLATSFSGRAIVSILAEGDKATHTDSLTQTNVTATVLPRESDLFSPDFTAKTDTLTGLTGGASYTVKMTDGTSKTFTAASDGTYNFSADPDLTGKTFASISKDGDGTSTVSSLPVTFTATVLPCQTTPSGVFTPSTGLLTGLTGGKAYTLTFADNQTYSFTAAADGSYDLSNDSEIAGETIKYLTADGDGTSTADSLPQTDITSKILGHLDQPHASFDPATGLLTGLTGGASYSVAFSDGTSLSLTADAKGTYDLASDPQAVGKTLSSLVCKGDGTSSLDSAAQTDTSIAGKTVLPRETAPSASFDSHTAVLTGLTGGADYSLTFTDGTVISLTAGSDGTFDLASDPNNYGLVPSSLVKKAGTGTIASTAETGFGTDMVLPHEDTPAGAYSVENGTLTGLTGGASYVVAFTDGTSTAITADAKGNFDLAGTAEALNKTVKSVVKTGDYANTSDSLAQTSGVTGLVLPHEATPTAAYSATSGILSNLQGSASYIVGFTDGTQVTFTAQADGTYDLSSDPKADGKTISGIVKAGDRTATCNSLPQTDITSTVLPRASVNAAGSATSYASGKITGLVPNQAYELTVAGLASPVSVTADASGVIDVTAVSSLLYGKNITGIVAKGDGTGTIDSLSQAASITTPSKLDVPSYVVYDGAGTLSGLVSGHTYEISFTDANGTVSTKTVTADASGKLVVSDTENRDLAGLTITSLTDKGDLASNTLDSEAYAPAGGIALPTKETSPDVTGVAFVSEQAVLTGLTPDTDYLVTVSTGETYKVHSDGNGEADLGSVDGLIGKKVTSLALTGTSGRISSDPSPLTGITETVKAHETTPAAVFVTEKGNLTGLTPDKEYVIKFTDGSSKTIKGGTDGTYDLSKDTDAVGKTIASLTKKGDGSATSDSLPETSTDIAKAVLAKGPTPAAVFDQQTGLLTSLTPDKDYLLTFTDQTSETIHVGTDGSYDLATDPKAGGKTLAELVLKGDGQTVCDSAAETLNVKVLAKEATPAGTYDPLTGVISGLTGNRTYEIDFSDGTSVSLTADEKGTIDLSADPKNTDKTLTGLVLKGVSGETIASASEPLTGKVLARETTPAASYTAAEGTLTGLTAGKSYILTMTDGTKKTLTADKDGKIDLAAVTDLSGKTLSTIVLQGDGTSKMDSLPQTGLAVKVLPHAATPDLTASDLNQKDGVLTGLVPNATYVFTDKNGKTYEVTADGEGKASVTANPSLYGLETASLIQKGDQKTCVDSLKETLALTFPTKEAIVAAYKTAGSQAIDDYASAELGGEAPNAETQAAIDEAKTKIAAVSADDPAAAQSQIAALVAAAEVKIKSQKEAQVTCGYHWLVAYVTIAFVLFMLLWSAINPKGFDKGSAIVDGCFGVFLIVMSFFVRCAICLWTLPLGWVSLALVLAYQLISMFVKKKGQPQEEKKK